MATFTRDQILEAASTCTTITAVAQRLGCCGTKLSGGTAKRLRAIAPELDELLLSNRAGSSTVCVAKVEPPVTSLISGGFHIMGTPQDSGRICFRC